MLIVLHLACISLMCIGILTEPAIAWIGIGLDIALGTWATAYLIRYH